MNSETNKEIKKPKPVNQRGTARLAAVQALYQMDMTGKGVLDVAAEYENFRLGKIVDDEQYLKADAQWFRTILSGVVERQKTIDPIIRGALLENWPLSRIDSTMRAILRAGTFELSAKRDVPTAVIVTEYVNITQAFYEGEESRVVNAVLDRIARQLRGERSDNSGKK